MDCGKKAALLEDNEVDAKKPMGLPVQDADLEDENPPIPDSLSPGITDILRQCFKKWFTMKRHHAVIVMDDSLYCTKFKKYCRPGMDGRNCYADEHCLETFFKC